MGIRGLHFAPKKPTHVLYIDGLPTKTPFDIVAPSGTESTIRNMTVFDTETNKEVGEMVTLTAFAQGRGGLIGDFYLVPGRSPRRYNRKGVEFEGW
jgi:hypothetical protein